MLTIGGQLPHPLKQNPSRGFVCPGFGKPRLGSFALPAFTLASLRRASKPSLGAKGKKGGRQRGGSTREQKNVSQPISEGKAYEHETRKIILQLSNAVKKAPDQTQILKDVTLGMYRGAKIGILGVNGAGKSTVMRILAGKDDDFIGELEMELGIKVGFLEQEPVLDAETVIENLEPALEHTRSMLREFEDISVKMTDEDADMDALMEQMGSLQEQIDARDGWELDAKLEQAMEALRCPPKDAKIEHLSGGERRRVAICRLLLTNPDILMLDEPTNHLDAQSVAWLERFLHDYKGTVVAITHDRYFLDNVAGWILELDQGQGIPFEGNYSDWLASKAKRLQTEGTKQKTLERQISQELEFIQATRAGQQKKGKARQRRYDELVDSADKFSREAGLDSIIIKPGPRIKGDVIVAKDLSKGYGNSLLIDAANFQIPPGSVVGIIGPNGTGKSTLFKMIMGYDKPDAGQLRVGDSIAPMYVDQSRDELDDDLTVLEAMTGGLEKLEIGGREVLGRAYCAWFNFRGSRQQQLVSTLSGGERNRLQLARTLLIGGNLLLLDEPSNDLDVDTLRALETAIQNFAGTTMVVSHDRWFLDRIATHVLAYEGESKLVFFEGGYSDYEEDRIARTGVLDPTAAKYMPMPVFN